ncbi:TRAP transporter small permease [Desulfobacula sp.]|uniref:TRAP transporter small permease n=1 Tax=Desulfobacula sp. TaxID=2593537 RepID=UPI0025BBB721|nr:TRAP transporter small permease [Desulfobacula sp.]MBC2703579.1 TRAP transporter small permease [Desulfobacula sp.]MCK4767117.1 TRAP transporter small permease [Desulfobacula sp.]
MIEKASYRINQWIEYMLFGLGFTMTLIVAVQVFFRYVLNHSLFWSEELARFLLVWLTFLGASSAYYRKVNPGVDFLYAKLSPLLRKLSSICTHLASMALFIVMIIYGYQFAWFVRLQISPALQIPKWIILSIIPISGVILMIHAVTFLFAELKADPHDH